MGTWATVNKAVAFGRPDPIRVHRGGEEHPGIDRALEIQFIHPYHLSPLHFVTSFYISY